MPPAATPTVKVPAEDVSAAEPEIKPEPKPEPAPEAAPASAPAAEQEKPVVEAKEGTAAEIKAEATVEAPVAERPKPQIIPVRPPVMVRHKITKAEPKRNSTQSALKAR